MESVSAVGVLDKAIAVLRAIEQAGPQTLLELQHFTGLPRATLHRLAVALEAHGLLRREESGRFCLGLSLAALGAIAADSFPIASIARPHLLSLVRATGESVQLYVREGDRRRCAVSFPSPKGLRWIVAEGSLLPLHLGSAGRALSGQHPADGWIETVEEREAGVASVSAPIVAAPGTATPSTATPSTATPSTGRAGESGVVLAAVSVGGPIARMLPSPGARFGGDVVATARAIERDLVRRR